ncbi:hypothetical protein [Pseudomonas syringae]|uniref:hypothetical protein n=1 Tax=Pseudomonas syringae TaxID=317 RepID=UPI00070D09EA|nr:hypothetical protein [Pseudomonas syringae]
MDLRIAEISTHFVKKPRKTSIPNEMKPSRIKGLGWKEGVFHSNRDWRTLREWTPEAGLSNQWLGQLINIYDMTCHLT